MPKSQQFPQAQFTLILCDQAGQKINGFSSSRDLEATKILALGALRLLSDAQYVHIYPYEAYQMRKDDDQLQPSATVTRPPQS